MWPPDPNTIITDCYESGFLTLNIFEAIRSPAQIRKRTKSTVASICDLKLLTSTPNSDPIFAWFLDGAKSLNLASVRLSKGKQLSISCLLQKNLGCRAIYLVLTIYFAARAKWTRSFCWAYNDAMNRDLTRPSFQSPHIRMNFVRTTSSWRLMGVALRLVLRHYCS